MIILKVTKNHLSLEDKLLENPQVGDQIDPLPAFLGLSFFLGADIRVIMGKKV